MTQAEQIIKAWQSKGLDTIAVVCIDEAEAEKVTAALQGSVELNTGDAENGRSARASWYFR